jgi:hypothetical protein
LPTKCCLGYQAEPGTLLRQFGTADSDESRAHLITDGRDRRDAARVAVYAVDNRLTASAP